MVGDDDTLSTRQSLGMQAPQWHTDQQQVAARDRGSGAAPQIESRQQEHEQHGDQGAECEHDPRVEAIGCAEWREPGEVA